MDAPAPAAHATPPVIPQPDLPQGCTARPPTMADADAVVAVIRAAEAHDGQRWLTTREDVVGDWSRPSMDLGSDALLVERGQEVVAHGEVFQGRAFVFVHPAAQGLGIGSALAGWTEAWARARGGDRIGQSLRDGTAGVDLLRGRGYQPRWTSWVFELELDEPLTVPTPAPGVTVRTVRRPEDDVAVHEVVETAFSEWPDRDVSMGPQDWAASFLARSDGTPDLRLVLEDADGRLVGAALCSIEDGVGWVDQLAVAVSHRGRGLGRLLLAESFTRFRDLGLSRASLTTDSRTGARTLYEHLGMTLSESFTRLSLDL